MVSVAINGTNGSHSGGYIGNVTSASSDITVPNGTVARIGDPYYCPEHGDQTLSGPGSTIAICNGQPLAINGTAASCGAILYTGFAEILTVAS